MRSSKRLRLVSSLIAVGLLAAACGGDDGKTNEPTGTEPKLEGKNGGILQLAGNGDVDFLDPQRTYYTPGFAIQRVLTRQLLTFKAAPAPQGNELVPDLAEAMPEVTNDGKTWTFKLRDGLKFSDGTPITSADIKYGVERAFATDILSGGPPYMQEYLEGGDAFKGPYKNPEGLKSIEVPDAKTIVFKLKQPFADFKFVAALPTTTPVPKAKDTKEKYNTQVVASGPYMLKKYEPTKLIHLVRNPNWSRESDPVRGKGAFVDEIIVTQGVDPADIFRRLEAGDADLTFDTSTEPQDVAKVLNNPGLKARSESAVTGCLRYFTLNTTVAPFTNIKARQAIQYAIDKETYRTARGGPIAGDFATTILPPSVVAHKKFDLYPAAPTGDVAKAKQLLAEAGVKPGTEIEMLTTNAGKGVTTAAAIQAALARVGLKVKIKSVAPGVYYSELGTPSKNIPMGFAAWCADWPGASTYIAPLFAGNLIKSEGNHNYAEINNPEVNDLIERANKEQDVAKADALWAEADRKIMEQSVIVPLLYDKTLVIRSERVKGAFLHPYFAHEDLVTVSVL